jgi:hypothetical protein
MRVRFNFVAGNGGAWPDDVQEQTDWQNDYISRVQTGWSKRLLLERQGDSPNYLKYYATYVTVTADPANPHFIANVSYATSFTKSSVNDGNNVATLDSEDTDIRTRREDETDYVQYPARHEFGHMLGRPHIACDSNDDPCYGGNHTERSNIMGMGSKVTAVNAVPFQDAMKKISNLDWNAKPYKTLTRWG